MITPGKAKLEYHYFPLQQHDPGASLGAMAAECAADQGAFWPYHDKLFAAAAAQGMGGFTMDRLIQYAEELNLNSQDFTQCLTSQTYSDYVEQSRQQAVDLGLSSTPSILINGELLANPFDYDALAAQVDQAAQNAAAK